MPRLPGARPVIAALYVETDGCYYGLPGVDPWDAARDARQAQYRSRSRSGLTRFGVAARSRGGRH